MRASAYRIWFLATTLLVGLFFVTPNALAHKVTIFAWVEAGQVHTESKFNGGKRVKAGKIEVFDHEENKVLEGATNAQGYFAFPVPSQSKALKIVLKAGMGHGNHWLLTAQDLGAAAPGTTPAGAGDTHGDISYTATAEAAPIDDQSVERIVARVLDKKLAPIKAQMADQAWGLRDLLGGLGYILGLVGLASYLQSRKKRSTKS